MKSFEPFKAKIEETGRVYIDIKVYRHDLAKSATIRFKYDSGSDTTTISLDDLTALGYSTEDIIADSYSYGSASTASGDEYQSYAIDLRVTNIMGQVIPSDYKIPFTCLTKRKVERPKHCEKDCELTGCFYGGFRSLLGNDILSAFDIVTDRNNNVMEFTKIADLTHRNNRYPRSKLNEVQIDV